ncbi:hypothetical protein BOX15_Mlig023950g1 [Macrostomum lignano]|uniref:Protein-tyrosine-phosphatase n=1 Tax=Macrostomum lignano TaxID=282301 RepID=A0A267E9E0_9PLAT|nr:hypothetical protein BOX15_Mlig023950g1 [Macrostomum lignano]
MSMTMFDFMCIRSLFLLVFLSISVNFVYSDEQEFDRLDETSREVLNKAFTSQLGLIESQSIGCLFDKGVCAPFENCLDDDLFGTCVANYADNMYFKYRIPRQLLHELKLIMRSLVEQNYTWHDLFTQCSIRAALVSSSIEIPTDLSICDEFAVKGGIRLQRQIHRPPIDDGLGGHGRKRSSELTATERDIGESTFDESAMDDGNDGESLTSQPPSSTLADAIRAVLHDKPTGSVADHSAAASYLAARSKYSAMIGDRLSKRLAESDRLVDGRFLRIQFSRPEHVQPAQIQQFIAEFNKVFGKRLLDENFSIDGSRNEVLFKLTDSAARSDVKQYLDKLNYVLKTDSGETFSWTKYDFGRQRNPAAVSELSSSWSQQTRVTSTLLVCAVVLAMILALFALFIVQRFRSSKRKLREMTSSTGALDSSDYKELCRQRMSEKASGGGVEPVSTRLAAAAAAAKKTVGGSPNSPTGSWSDDPITTDMDITTGHLILNYMENYLNNKEKLEQEWADLCSYEAEQRSSAVGATPENAAKNRYQDLLPYDHSRVKLNPEHSASGGDYINASYIYDSDPKTKAYILTQGPMESTAPDFWQMVWECGSVAIVNLTGLGGADCGGDLCTMYWPAEGSRLFNKFEVHLVSEHVWFEDFIVRNFYLKNVGTGEARTVTMFHFLAWEEAGLPSSAKALLDFRRKVNKSYKGRATPLVVHCSDGCGRSGTYCLLDLALGRIAKGVKEIDLAASLEHLRDQRAGLVKTRDQFEFVVSAIAEEVHNVLKTLSQ